MKQDLTTGQELRMQTRITRQQLRYARLLEMNSDELEEAVDVEIAENPALERGDDPEAGEDDFKETAEQLQAADYRPDDAPDYRPAPQRQNADREAWYARAADRGESLYDILLRQITQRELRPEVRDAAIYAAGNVDSNGYLRRQAAVLADEMLFNTGVDVSAHTMEQGVEVVKSLDPPGVGASDLQECLVLQLRRAPGSRARADALRIVEERFDDFTKKHYSKIRSSLDLSEERVRDALDAILALNPKPGAAYGSEAMTEAANIVTPDFVVETDGNEITVEVANTREELHIVSSFRDAAERMERERRRRQAGSEFILNRYNDARDFMAALERRQETLLAVMTAIVKLQRDYVLTGDEHALRPMGLKDIGALTGLDLSVVSRATNGKYVAMPWGILPLRFFFSEAFAPDSEGEAASGRQIEAAIRRLVNSEDKKKPMSDDALCCALQAEGFAVSRRTVAKYRDRLGIPVGRLRREL